MNTACKSHGYLENFTPCKSLVVAVKTFHALKQFKVVVKKLKVHINSK